ncbi:MAG: GGDEF domain-containing protein [Amphritea sp.]|nr:GGDEF domain-containing protein [Amphritea sp.]
MYSTSHRQHGPLQLLSRLRIAAVISLLAILATATYGIGQLYKSFVIDDALDEAISLGEAFVSGRQSMLLNEFGLSDRQPVMNPARLIWLDQRIQSFLSPYHILKIKVFSPQGIILYSTDHTIIGQDNSTNPRLGKALAGIPDSMIQTKDQMLDLSHEMHFNVDVVETYVPIYNDDKAVIGAFEIYQDMSREHYQVERGIYLSIISLAVILIVVYITAFYFIRRTALRLLAAQQDLERFATIDPLTHLFNRREILHRAENELERFSRRTRPGHFTLMMIDLDHFKAVNDNYGHAAGDAVLEQAALLLRNSLRSYCYIGRYGGEEFIALLPDTPPEHSEIIAERLNRVVAEHSFAFEDQTIRITTSIGVISTENHDDGLSELLSRADNNLYKAKASGRNCFVASY